MFKKLSSFAVGALLVLGALFSPAVALAAEKTPPPPDLSGLSEYFEQQGVPEVAINELLEKVLRGELLDSQKSGVLPVKEVTVGSTLRQTFADGSVRATTVADVPAPKGGITSAIQSVSGCTQLANSGGYTAFANCLIKTTDGITVLSFKTGYSRSAFGTANVSGWTAPTAATAYGSVTSATFTFTRAAYSNGAPAQVQAHTMFTSWNGLSSEDIYLNFLVTPAGYSVTIY